MKVRIDRWVYGGAGIGVADDGRALAVPFTLPNELAQVDGDGLTIHEPSPERVEPRCPHFGACGGCQYQHARYTAQGPLKTGILRDTLHAAGLGALPEIELHTAEPWGYRNRIRLRIARTADGLRFGYNRRGGHEFLPIHECPIAHPLLLRAANVLLSALSASGELTTWADQMREVELFTSPDPAALQMTLFVAADRAGALNTLCGRLKALVPELAGAGVIVVGASGRQERPGSTWGASGLRYAAAGRSFWVSRGSFFQVDRFLVDTLIHLAIGARRGKLAWDLYAGVGLFSRVLMESFDRVVAVEVAAADLAVSLKGPNAHAVASTSADFLRRAVIERDRPELIVVDPPRAGLGDEVCALLGRVAAREIVYVSCDPVTLARDLKQLTGSGYGLERLQLVDLFPQTFHMETVAVLGRTPQPG